MPGAFLILGIITSPIFVDAFPVVFTVLPLVISDVLLVLLTISPLAAGESFLVNFIPSFTTGFENRNVLCTLSLLLDQDSLSVLCVILLVVRPFYRQPSGHSPAVNWSTLCGVLQTMSKAPETHTELYS